MNRIPHTVPDPEVQAMAYLESLDRKLRGKKVQAKPMAEAKDHPPHPYRDWDRRRG